MTETSQTSPAHTERNSYSPSSTWQRLTPPVHTEQNSYSPSGTWQRPGCCQAPSSAPPCTPQRHLSLTNQPGKVVSASQSLVYHIQALATICSGHACTKPQRDCWNLGKNHCIDSYSADHHPNYASSWCVYMYIHTYMCVCECVCVCVCVKACRHVHTCLCDHCENWYFHMS